MGEMADAWAQRKQKNLLGAVPNVIEMQSEGGGRRCRSRRASSWLALNNVYGFSGSVANDPQYVQNRWGADADRLSRRSTKCRHSRSFDFR